MRLPPAGRPDSIGARGEFGGERPFRLSIGSWFAPPFRYRDLSTQVPRIQMQPSDALLTARTQNLISVLLTALALVAVFPVLDLLAARWPFHLAEAPWRYQVFVGVFSFAPWLLMVLCLIAAIGTLGGNRPAVRGAAVALVALAIAFVLMIPSFSLDLLTVRRLMPQDVKRMADTAAVKNVLYGALLVLVSGLAGLRAWKWSAPAEKTRRDKGDGLVVGQPKAPVNKAATPVNKAAAPD
jgi:hypothetical protein